YIARVEADIHERLPLFGPYDLHRALESGHQLARIVHALAVTAARLDDVLEARRGLERGEGRPGGLRRVAFRIDAERRAVHRRPARVVEDDVEHRQAHAFADEMAGRRVAEHVGAVAEGRDQRLVGRGELRAERGAQAPAQAARGRVAEVAHRLAERQLLEQDRVLVDED